MAEKTKKCPHCKMDIPSKATKCPHCQSKLPGLFSSIVVCLLSVLFVIWLVNVFSGPSPKTGSQPNPVGNEEITKEEKPLELLNFRCYTEYDFFHIVGEVKNISDESLEGVVAVGSAYTIDDRFVKSDDALIDYNPILPGQISPFEVLFSGNPEIERCKVEFKKFWGGTIPTKR